MWNRKISAARLFALLIVLAGASRAANADSIEDRLKWWEKNYPQYAPKTEPPRYTPPSTYTPPAAYNEDYVGACAARTKGASRFVQGKYWSYGKYRWNGIRYWLQSNGSYVSLTAILRVYFPDASAWQKQEFLRSLDGEKSCIRNFFWRYRINLDLRFTADGTGLTSADTENFLNLRKNGERGPTFSMHDWAFELGGHPLTSACSAFTHELGHMLGLPDEYPEATDKVGEYDSIMRECHRPPDSLRFYPRHLKIMLGELCG